MKNRTKIVVSSMLKAHLFLFLIALFTVFHGLVFSDGTANVMFSQEYLSNLLGYPLFWILYLSVLIAFLVGGLIRASKWKPKLWQ